MADKMTQKKTIGQQAATPEDTNVKAAVTTGDRELSDADLDKVAGGSAPEPAAPLNSRRARAL